MKKILLIDDDQFMRDVVATKLTDNNYQVEVASNGDDGFAKIESNTPDLILLDLDLPDISGVDILTELKTNKIYKSIPVIIFSNNDDANIQKKIKQLGADSFFVKASINIDELHKKIDEFFTIL